MRTQPQQTEHSNLQSSDSRLYGIIPDGLKYVWPEVLPMLREQLARENFGYTEESIFNALMEAKMQLWLSYRDEGLECFCLTWTLDYPLKRVCQVFLAVGTNMRNWVSFIEYIGEWAKKEQGCSEIEVMGRKGWERLIKQYGFKFNYQVLGKKL